jgi:threonine dehydratase
MATSTTPALLTLQDFRDAQVRIRGVAAHTPLVRLDVPGLDAEVWIKAESLQPIGAFKIRGAWNARSKAITRCLSKHRGPHYAAPRQQNTGAPASQAACTRPSSRCRTRSARI